MAEPVVLARVEDGGVGVITLNRPKALNSLNQEMVTLVCDTLRAWTSSNDIGVNVVVLRGGGPPGRAFCAGGDVKHAAAAVRAGDHRAAVAFFQAEYVMDALIATLGVPHVAVLDGVTMGGGAGVSMHGHFRVATERTLFAMPECAIGLFPDVGMMALLPRLPGHLGKYLALTGARLAGRQVKAAGLATHYVPSSHAGLVEPRLRALGGAARDPSRVWAALTALEEEAEAAAAREGDAAASASSPSSISPAAAAAAAAARGQPQKAAAAAAAATAEGGGGAAAPASSSNQSSSSAPPRGDVDVAAMQPAIDRCFRHDSVPAILAALRADLRANGEPEWERGALAQLERGSPLSAAVTLEYYRRARAGAWGALECLEQDAVLVGHFMSEGEGDFVEGVRARLVDKDDAPRWRHARAEDVPADAVAALFAPRDPGDAIDLRRLLAEGEGAAAAAAVAAGSGAGRTRAKL